MTLIAVFTLIAHGLIMEGVVQHKSGINIIKATLIRIGVAILTVLVISHFFSDTSQSVVIPPELTTQTPILEVLKTWGVDTLILLSKILGIIMGIMIALESLRSLGWLESSLKIFHPILRILRLSERTAMMWVAAAAFGVFYGGAVIVEEAKKGTLTKEELESLHISIGINHAMVEDPALFAILGLNAFWLWVPRIIIAIVAVQGYRIIKYIKNKWVSPS
jgi:hypothetical protein